MGSLKPLVDGECGHQNALVRFTSQVLNDSGANRTRALLPSTSRQLQPHEQLAQEYFSEINARTVAPRNFSMQSLIREIGGVTATDQSNQAAWTKEFLASGVRPQPGLTDSWTRDFLAQNSLQQSANVGNGEVLLDQAWQTAALPQNAGALQWSSEYLMNAENRLQTIGDSEKIWEREYADFQDQIARGDLQINDDGSYGEKQDFWSHLENEWDSLARGGEHEWLQEYSGVSSLYKDYTFQEENPYLDVSDPLAEGKRLLAEGDLGNAILHFESAVQKMANNPEAWEYLGMTQAENEQEPSAIAALRKCLELEPGNQEALFRLAASYCNESLYNDASKVLSNWLAENPSYAHLVPPELKDPGRQPIASFLDRDFFAKVEETFLKAAASQPGQIDANLQNSLGVLYNISGNYDRAVESLQAALQVNPDDARLWNRLGATLANSDKAAQAVSAYSKALELYPGYVRARYNLGISCLNLRSHNEAIEHFLSALSLQQRGIGPTAKQNMSDSIWNSLRVATMNFPNRMELLSFCDKRDFEGFGRVFRGKSGMERGKENEAGPSYLG